MSSFELEPPRRTEPTINLSALIDIVFILMIFVILGATFDRARALDIVLPESDATAESAKDVDVLRVPPTGPLLLNDEPVPEAELEARLRSLGARTSVIVIQADADTPIQRAINLLDLARASGFETASIATLPR